MTYPLYDKKNKRRPVCTLCLFWTHQPLANSIIISFSVKSLAESPQKLVIHCIWKIVYAVFSSHDWFPVCDNERELHYLKSSSPSLMYCIFHSCILYCNTPQLWCNVDASLCETFCLCCVLTGILLFAFYNRDNCWWLPLCFSCGQSCIYQRECFMHDVAVKKMQESTQSLLKRNLK